MPGRGTPALSSPRAVGRGSLGLGPFLSELESRLRALSAQELSAALLAHAECLPALERTSFLEIFTSVEPPSGGDEAGRGTTVAAVSAGADDEMLIADIKAFEGRLGSGVYVQGWGWDEDLHDERSFGDESWADEMDDLLGGAETAFLDGDLDLARIAYEPLLKAFERHAEGFCGPEEPERMLSTDVGEAKARYLRAVYETTPPSERADTLFEEMERFATSAARQACSRSLMLGARRCRTWRLFCPRGSRGWVPGSGAARPSRCMRATSHGCARRRRNCAAAPTHWRSWLASRERATPRSTATGWTR